MLSIALGTTLALCAPRMQLIPVRIAEGKRLDTACFQRMIGQREMAVYMRLKIWVDEGGKVYASNLNSIEYEPKIRNEKYREKLSSLLYSCAEKALAKTRIEPIPGPWGNPVRFETEYDISYHQNWQYHTR